MDRIKILNLNVFFGFAVVHKFPLPLREGGRGWGK